MPTCSFNGVPKTWTDTSDPWSFPILSAWPNLSDLFPVRQRLGERVGAVLLAAQITERAPPCFPLIVAVALDQVIASRVAGSA